MQLHCVKFLFLSLTYTPRPIRCLFFSSFFTNTVKTLSLRDHVPDLYKQNRENSVHDNIELPLNCRPSLLVKISPIKGPRCPESSRKLRFPDYVTMAQDGGKVVRLTHRPLFAPRKYSFLFETESTPGP